MTEGRKVLVFQLRPIRKEVMRKVKDKNKNRCFSKSYTPIPPERILPYSCYTERGIAQWLYEEFGAGHYVIRAWREKRRKDKSGYDVELFRLIEMQVIQKDYGNHIFNTLDKRSISKSKAWRENV